MVAHACSPSYSGSWGKRIASTWKAEVAVSRDCVIALQPGNRARLHLKKRKYFSTDISYATSGTCCCQTGEAKIPQPMCSLSLKGCDTSERSRQCDKGRENTVSHLRRQKRSRNGQGSPGSGWLIRAEIDIIARASTHVRNLTSLFLFCDEVLLCHPSWRAVVWHWLTATSAS